MRKTIIVIKIRCYCVRLIRNENIMAILGKSITGIREVDELLGGQGEREHYSPPRKLRPSDHKIKNKKKRLAQIDKQLLAMVAAAADSIERD